MSTATPNVPEITVADLVRSMPTVRAQLLDVREDDEWQAGRIQGSVHIPLGDVAARYRELDPARPVVAICRSGVRSLYATEILLQAGFHDVQSLNGGILAWEDAGHTLET